jgi:hypothetical protein
MVYLLTSGLERVNGNACNAQIFWLTVLSLFITLYTLGFLCYSRAVIPKAGDAYPQDISGYAKNKKNNVIKLAHTSTYKFEITATILITNILLIWRVKFMEIGCQGARKWKKVGNHCSKAIPLSLLVSLVSRNFKDTLPVLKNREKNW